MRITRRRLIAIFAMVVIGVALGIGARALFVSSQMMSSSSLPSGGFGEVAIGGPFALVDHNDKPRTDGEFRGRLMLVAFGYTFCPDVCPLDLQLMGDALAILGPDGDKVQPIFISVDPARDTPAVLKSFVGHFSPRIVGLTGTPEATTAAARAYRVHFKINGDPAQNPNYLVDHSAMIYLMGRDGKFLTHFTHETPPERVAATIRRYL